MADFLQKIKEAIPGTTEYEKVVKSQRISLEVMGRWSAGETVYSQIKQRVENNRSFYLGDISQQFNSQNTEGTLRIPINAGATVLDLMIYLLSNNPPTVQAKPSSNDRMGQIEASVAEDLGNKALRMADFRKQFRDSCWLFLVSGFVWWFPFWNVEKKFGKKANKFDFSYLNPLTTRVFYKSSDYRDVSSFITTKRMTPAAILKEYDGFEARPDSDNIFLPVTIRGVDDGKTTVFKEYDEKNVVTIIDGRVAETKEHGLDFAPVIQINNKFVINDAHGHDEVFRMLPVAQELNMLVSATSEIARDLGYPSILEYNNALGGKKLPKLRGNKIPVRRTDKGEALEFLANTAQIGPMLEQIRLLLDLFHFVALMPKAAAGIFESSVTSGFQARIAMQPATLNTENKKIDFDDAIVKLVKTALYYIEQKDPKALELDEGTRFTDLWELEFDVKWPDNLPIDIAREIQNLILGIQNSLTSVTQAVDKYNVMMGMGSTEETLEYLKQEAKNAELSPDRALKVAQVEQTLAQIGESMSAIREKLGVSVMPDDVLPGGNETNALRAMGGPSEDEQKPVPDTATEAVVAESTGGEVPTL